MTRKTRGKGCIFQLDKGKNGKKPKGKCHRWRLIVSLGKDPRTGAYRQKSRNFNGTYTEAQQALRSFMAEIETSGFVQRSNITFAEYAEHFVDFRVANGEIQERTADNLRYSLNALGHLIGELRLQEITPRTIEEAFIGLRAGDTLSGKPLSERTLYNIHLASSLMFAHARERDLVSANPLDRVPRPKKDSAEKMSLSAVAYSSLLSSLDPAHYLQCAVLLCAELGLRRSEALGLSWGDIDFVSETVNVHTSTDDRGGLKGTKTEAGSRLLPLPEHLAAALLRRRKPHLRRKILPAHTTSASSSSWSIPRWTPLPRASRTP